MHKLKIVGMDPSLNNWGLAYATLDLDTMLLTVDALALVQTSPEGNKQTRKQVRKNSEDLARARLLHDGALARLDGYALACVEVPVGSQSARSMASYGVCIGVMAAVAARLPVIEVTAGEVKKAGCGHKDGTKEEMIRAMMGKYPGPHWPMQSARGVTSVIASRAEHMADALAAVEAAMLTDQFRALLAMLRAGRAA